MPVVELQAFWGLLGGHALLLGAGIAYQEQQ